MRVRATVAAVLILVLFAAGCGSSSTSEGGSASGDSSESTTETSATTEPDPTPSPEPAPEPTATAEPEPTATPEPEPEESGEDREAPAGTEDSNSAYCILSREAAALEVQMQSAIADPVELESVMEQILELGEQAGQVAPDSLAEPFDAMIDGFEDMVDILESHEWSALAATEELIALNGDPELVAAQEAVEIYDDEVCRIQEETAAGDDPDSAPGGILETELGRAALIEALVEEVGLTADQATCLVDEAPPEFWQSVADAPEFEAAVSPDIMVGFIAAGEECEVPLGELDGFGGFGDAEGGADSGVLPDEDQLEEMLDTELGRSAMIGAMLADGSLTEQQAVCLVDGVSPETWLELAVADQTEPSTEAMVEFITVVGECGLEMDQLS